RPPPSVSTLLPYTTLCRSDGFPRRAPDVAEKQAQAGMFVIGLARGDGTRDLLRLLEARIVQVHGHRGLERHDRLGRGGAPARDQDRKSTRLNSSHVKNSYA